jgi:hypothetical protein
VVVTALWTFSAPGEERKDLVMVRNWSESSYRR